MTQKLPAPGRTTLKIIAVLSMFCDHLAYIFVDARGYAMLYRGMRIVGRLSFPIFCFVLVQGFLSTRDVKKYLVRLAVFAAVSEIPYDLAFFKTPFYLEQQNVFFTLLIGMFVLVELKKYESNFLYEGIIMVGGSVVAFLLRTDYSYFGVVLISGFYLLRQSKMSYTLWAMMLMFFSGGLQMYAILSLPFCYMYDSQKEERRLPKYAFYAFYPLHLLIMWAIWRVLV